MRLKVHRWGDAIAPWGTWHTVEVDIERGVAARSLVTFGLGIATPALFSFREAAI